MEQLTRLEEAAVNYYQAHNLHRGHPDAFYGTAMLLAAAGEALHTAALAYGQAMGKRKKPHG